MPASLATHDFGSQLKYLRKRAHLTQRDLGALEEVPAPPTQSRWGSAPPCWASS